MRILALLVVLILVATVAAAIYFRLVGSDPADWHVDPQNAVPPASPNFSLRQGDTAATVSLSFEDTVARLDAIATSERADILAGDLASGWITYVARSRLMGYPDYISVRLTDSADGTRVEIFSRSRFGHSDLGVNEARVARWLAALAP